MLVFGIATAVTTIHRVLPHAVSSVLAIERFQSQRPLVCVLEMISKVTYIAILSIFNLRDMCLFIKVALTLSCPRGSPLASKIVWC